MSRKIKIYVDQEPDYYLNDEAFIIRFLLLPRWWNPIFMFSISFYPWVMALTYACSSNEGCRHYYGRWHTFFRTLTLCYESVADMLKDYKI